MGETLPLAKTQDAILEFLRNRDDAVLFGAQAVNAYVEESRMTQDVDIMSTRGREFAEELRAHLAKTFTIAARVREAARGQGFLIYQLREPKNRHLADVRVVPTLPPNRVVAEVRVPTPEELIAQKVLSYVSRRGQPKSGTDWRDLTLLLLIHPQLKSKTGAVLDRLQAANANAEAIAEWNRLVETEIRAPDDADEFGG